MIERLAFYLIVYPMSFLPLWVLYRVSDLFYLLLVTIVPYRKEVISANLKRSFPKYTEHEIRRLRRRFYRHFSDLVIEGVKNLSITEAQLKRRVTVKNPELMDSLFEANKSVLLISGHYGNWEWLIKIQDLLFRHQAYGIGMPMTSKFWDRKVNEKRQSYGMKVIHAKNYKEILAKDNSCKAILLLSDQSPGDSKKSYWTNFLNQTTAVLFGAEMMTYELNFTPVFFKMRKLKRGYYEMELVSCPIALEEPQFGKLTEWHVNQLEELIIERPEFWLWSHKRWKREVPEDLEILKKQQHEKFTHRFGS